MQLTWEHVPLGPKLAPMLDCDGVLKAQIKSFFVSLCPELDPGHVDCATARPRLFSCALPHTSTYLKRFREAYRACPSNVCVHAPTSKCLSLSRKGHGRTKGNAKLTGEASILRKECSAVPRATSAHMYVEISLRLDQVEIGNNLKTRGFSAAPN